MGFAKSTRHLQDIDAHLRGGIPDRDLGALAAHWKVIPGVRSTLFAAADRPHYSRLTLPIADVKSAILHHPEFRTFNQSVSQLLATWRSTVEPQLKRFAQGGHPKTLIEAISEALLQTFQTASLQEDCYLIAADMRHLLNTYVQADPAEDLGNLNSLSLTQLIIETGVHDAIARKLNAQGKLTKDSIAEAIINNVRKTIIREQLTDPQFYAEMSRLLDDLIAQNRADAAAYEAFLKNAEALARKLSKQDANAGVPAALHGKPEAIVLFNNLPAILQPGAVAEDGRDGDASLAALALQIDLALREHAPAGWKGDETRERQVINTLFPILSRDREATLAVFQLVKNQPGY
jgi:hypothetical protein